MGCGRRHGGQCAVRARDRRRSVVGGRGVAGPGAGRVVRARPDRVPARRRRARLGSARPPAVDDHGDGPGSPVGRQGGAPVCRRCMAFHRGRRLRRLPRRAAIVVAGLAGGRASGSTRGDTCRVARAVGVGGGAVSGRRRSRRRSSTNETPGSRSTRNRREPSRARRRRSRWSAASWCRRCCARPRIGAGGRHARSWLPGSCRVRNPGRWLERGADGGVS